MIRDLKKKYPHLYKNTKKVVVPSGWKDILEYASGEIETAISAQEEPDLYSCLEVSSKEGAIHFSMTHTTHVISSLLRSAALLSQATCEMCSSSGIIRKKGEHKSVICDKCFDAILNESE